MVPPCPARAAAGTAFALSLAMTLAGAAGQDQAASGAGSGGGSEVRPPVPLVAEAGERRAASLDEMLRLAEGRSLPVRQAAAGRQIADAQALAARMAWIPALTASAGSSRTDGRVQGSFGDFRDVDFRTAAPFGRLSIGLNPAATWLGASAASQRAETAKMNERAVHRLILVRVSELYYALARAWEAVRIAGQAVKDSEDLLMISEVLLRQGAGRGDDLERARVEVAASQQRRLDAERSLHLTSIDLAAALALDPRSLLVPEPAELTPLALVAEDLDLEEVQRRAVEERPEVLGARSELEARRSDRSALKARLASPAVELFHQEGATGETYDELAQLTRSGVTATWTVSAAALQDARTAGRREVEASLAVEQAELEVRADCAAAWARARLASERIEHARTSRLAAEAALRISQVRFRNGASLAIEVIQAQLAVEQARLAEVSAVAEHNVAQVLLRAAAGDVSPADLTGRLAAASADGSLEPAGSQGSGGMPWQSPSW